MYKGSQTITIVLELWGSISFHFSILQSSLISLSFNYFLPKGDFLGLCVNTLRFLTAIFVFHGFFFLNTISQWTGQSFFLLLL